MTILELLQREYREQGVMRASLAEAAPNGIEEAMSAGREVEESTDISASDSKGIALTTQRIVFEVGECIKAFGEFIAPKLQAAGRAIQDILNTPPRPGYETLLVEYGLNRLEARYWASFFQRRGEDYAFERNVVRPNVIRTIRRIATSKARVKTIAKCAERLSETDARSWLVRLLDEAGFHHLKDRILSLLEKAAADDERACRQLSELARQVGPKLPDNRGAPVKVASICHERVLVLLSRHGKQVAYTWRDDDLEGFTDKVTQATRMEFGEFKDPRPAADRAHGRRARSTVRKSIPAASP
jgi:hypothetical protein